MATRSITLELPEDAVQKIEKAGFQATEESILPLFLEFLAGLDTRKQPEYTLAEKMAALEETYGMLADSELTMDEFERMKREERELEERKLNR